MESRLIIFVKNPEIGKVKTRLAAGIGPKMALVLYQKLVDHTLSVIGHYKAKTTVYFSEAIDGAEKWRGFSKEIQSGLNLGLRMLNSLNSEKVPSIIIGTDCYDLTPEIVDDSFRALEEYDVVIGPAEDGGYYLIGMREPHPELFEKKKWSTDSVFLDTIEDIKFLGLSHFILPTLSDIDNIEDLRKSKLNEFYEQYLSRNNQRSI